MPLISFPHGYQIRQFDSYGSGLFGASRGKRKHLGTDFVCVPDSPFPSCITGEALRHKRPYADDLRWDGVCIAGDNGIELTLFYLSPYEDILGSFVSSTDDIGICQDIRLRYPKDQKHATACTPHVHVQAVWPASRSLPMHWVSGEDYIKYQSRIYANVESLVKSSPW